MPTYFVKNAEELKSEMEICHFSLHKKDMRITKNWLPEKRPVKVALTCGASCPDAIVDGVLLRVLSFFENTRDVEQVLQPYREP
jgi:4-hydroxy-3-methylbut-2-enyl diphosphate reductase